MAKDTLLGPSSIILFGRVVDDLAVDGSKSGTRKGANKFLLSQLSHATPASDKPVFARIYGFSFEGCYYELSRPAIFLVHGEGDAAEDRVTETRFEPSAVAPSDANRTGVGTQAYSFSNDMRYWTYDKGDFSIRLDVESGPLDEILLDIELQSDIGTGAISGANVRGANVRGANVRGANVRGANVRGANVRGANVRGGMD